MQPPKLDYAPAEPGTRHPTLRYFWAQYALGAVIGLPLVGVSAWTVLSGRGPDQGGMQLLFVGVIFTAFVVGVLQLSGVRMMRPSTGGAAMAAGFVVGMFSSLAGIVLAIVFFS